MAWPTDWADRVRENGCAMCSEGRPDRIPHGVRVYSGPLVDAYVSSRAAQRGYVVAIFRGRHVNDLAELSSDELLGFWSEIARISVAMQQHFQPRKVNYEVLGNQIPHLHVHLTARFADGDVAPGQPLGVDRNLSLPAKVAEADRAALTRLLGS
jgi:diadenosine tetraphosphate (Ap4A) HIT family hydrolase